MCQFKVEVAYGISEIKQINKFENGRMVAYGYSIHHDMSGKEVSRTEPTKLGSIGWGNGEKFTEEDYVLLSRNS